MQHQPLPLKLLYAPKTVSTAVTDVLKRLKQVEKRVFYAREQILEG